jgi:glutathione synthase/RimK-type ligase-like ATP-grasp enzyme
MPRKQIRLITNNVSEGANELKARVEELGISCVKVRNRDAVLTRRGVLTVKWGSFPRTVNLPEGTVVLNDNAGRQVLNKLECFRALEAAGVPTPDYTADRAVAQGWFNAHDRIYERHTLSGSGGDGIRVVRFDMPEGSNTLNAAPLYTKGLLGKRREYRIHVFNVDGVQRLFVQQKLRRAGFTENTSYNNLVRNLEAGWVFAHNDIQPPRTVTVDAAVAAVTALRLSFGAVDVIEMDAVAGGSVVLEVNSAPGLQGATAGFYAQAIESVLEVN